MGERVRGGRPAVAVRWTDEVLVGRIAHIKQEEGRVNSSYLFANHRNLSQAILNHGGWAKYVKLAGFDPDMERGRQKNRDDSTGFHIG